MRDTRQNGDRRLGFALVLLLVTLGLHAQCSVTKAAEVVRVEPECHSGDIHVSNDGEDVFACVNGVLEPMVTLAESEHKAALASLAAGVASAIGGLLVGAGVYRGLKEKS